MKFIFTKIFFAIVTTLMLVTLLASHAFAFHSVDTTETFAKGLLTDSEAYYAYGYSSVETAHGLEFLVGGGFLDNFSYFLDTALIMQGSNIEISSVGFGFIWTIVETGKVALDFVPDFTFDANVTEGKMTFPGFDLFSCGAYFELNLTILKAFQPFIQAGFTGSYDADLKKFTWVVPLAVGAVIPVKGSVEFLLQFAWEPDKDSTWEENEKSVAAGFNIMATENLEVITGMGWEFVENEFGVTMGLIYAL